MNKKPFTVAYVKEWVSDHSDYSNDILKDSSSFANDKEFDRMKKHVADAALPKMREAFQEAANKVKIIEGLSTILQAMFEEYREPLDYGNMVVDF